MPGGAPRHVTAGGVPDSERETLGRGQRAGPAPRVKTSAGKDEPGKRRKLPRAPACGCRGGAGGCWAASGGPQGPGQRRAQLRPQTSRGGAAGGDPRLPSCFRLRFAPHGGVPTAGGLPQDTVTCRFPVLSRCAMTTRGSTRVWWSSPSCPSRSAITTYRCPWRP